MSATSVAQPTAHTYADDLVIEARGIASRSQADRTALRRLVAWRHGDVCIGQNDYAVAALQVTVVRRGTMGALRRPSSAQFGLLDVYVFDDAARALTPIDLAAPAGVWTLTRSPDGVMVVSDVRRTPLAPAPGTPVRAEVDALRAALRSADPERQRAALQRFATMRCFSLVADALALADSVTPVSAPGEGHVRLADGTCQTLDTSSTLGAVARSTVWTVTNALRDDDSPASTDPPERWRGWWRSLLHGT